MRNLQRKKQLGAGILMVAVLAMSSQEMVLGSEFPSDSSTTTIECQSLEDGLSSMHTAARKLFQKAYAAYAKARPLTAVQGNEFYAEAIGAIAQAVALEPENPDYLLLASQIYRGKGGVSYAKSYFSRAEAVLKKRIAQRPDSVRANLDYAILCYAGDARYWPEQEVYQKRARKYADKVIALCRAQEKTGKKYDNYSVALALAYLIKGNEGHCEKELKAAEDPAGKFYCALYEDTVKNKKWFWPTKDTGKEFMLYYMTDSNRNGFS